MKIRRKGDGSLALRRLKLRQKFPLIRAAYESGRSLKNLAIAFDLGEGMIWRALKKRGVQMRPKGGGHRRVDVCHCGKPALPRGARCARHERLRQAQKSLEWYHRNKSRRAELAAS